MVIYQDQPSWRTKNTNVRWMELKRRKDTRRNTWENPFRNSTLATANVVLQATDFYLLMYITSNWSLFFSALSTTCSNLVELHAVFCSIRFLWLVSDLSLAHKCWMITGYLWLQEVRITLSNICAGINTKKACSDVKMTGKTFAPF